MRVIRVGCAVGLAFSFALASFLAAEVPATADATAFPNYSLVRPGLAAAGQPSAEGLAQLKAMGFKTVINLRTEKEGAKDEEGVVKAAGLRYVFVPVSAETSQADGTRSARPSTIPRRRPFSFTAPPPTGSARCGPFSGCARGRASRRRRTPERRSGSRARR
jgi:hypothetical protein